MFCINNVKKYVQLTLWISAISLQLFKACNLNCENGFCLIAKNSLLNISYEFCHCQAGYSKKNRLLCVKEGENENNDQNQLSDQQNDEKKTCVDQIFPENFTENYYYPAGKTQYLFSNCNHGPIPISEAVSLC